MVTKKKVVCTVIFCLTFLCGIGIYFIHWNHGYAQESKVTKEIDIAKENDLVFRNFDGDVIEIDENEKICLDTVWSQVKNGEKIYLHCYETKETRELSVESKEPFLESLQPGIYQIYAKTQEGEIKNLSKYAQVQQIFSMQGDSKMILLE